MSFFNTNFTILLSFLIFVGLCWRHFTKPMAALLDQQIQEVTQDIHTSAQACARAQKDYQAAQKHSEKVHKDILALHQRTQEDLEKIKEQAQAQLTFLMALKDKTHQSKIDHLYHEKIHGLKAEAAQQMITVFQEILQQKVPPAKLKALTDQMVGQLVNLSAEVTA